MSHVLIVDDEESICWGLERLLTETGHDVSVAASAEEAFESVKHEPPDLVVLDVRLPGMDGLTAMERFNRLAGPIPIVVITAFGNLDVAVTAMRNGAFDYLAKPFDLEQAAALIDRALEHQHPARVAASETARQVGQVLLGQSPAMQEVFKRIALVAPTDSPVFITGESGTGKELVARAIHHHSTRADRPFVPIHLSGLSPTLVESELFGHVQGAFAGADESRRGMLELADDTTVFFDEAADIPASVQAKLLRVLEQQEVTPVGSAEPRASSFRVIAATGVAMRGERPEAALRRDLYYGMAAFEIALPPLRDRVEDIPLLAAHFLARTRRDDDPPLTFTSAAIDELCRRKWPGNVRQLRHAVEHGALLARAGRVDVEHLPAPIDDIPSSDSRSELADVVRGWARQQLAQRQPPLDLYQAFLNEAEPPLFETVLQATFQNHSAAADVLGIHRATLRKKLHGKSEDT